MGSNMRDVEEGRRLMLAGLPIVGQQQKKATAEKVDRKADPEEDEEDQGRITLQELVARAWPEYGSGTVTSEKLDELLEAATKAGKKTTRGSLAQAVYSLRKADAPKAQRKAAKLQAKAAKKERRLSAGRKEQPPPGKNNGATFEDLLADLKACMAQILNENAELKNRLARVMEAAGV